MYEHESADAVDVCQQLYSPGPNVPMKERVDRPGPDNDDDGYLDRLFASTTETGGDEVDSDSEDEDALVIDMN